MISLESCFKELLVSLVDNYRYRSDQLSLARTIQDVLRSGATGLFEAATGTGKTLGYLVPVLLEDGPHIISTGTRNLQDQLYARDLPALRSLFPEKRIALLKGRSNYLCPYRLNKHIELESRDQEIAHDLVSIRVWWSQSRVGDLNEVMDPEEKPGLVPLVTSTRDNCLASRCPDYLDCPLYRARDRALEADLVIVNHHLLFADLANREDQLRSLLPRVRGIVIDEAHQVPGIARQFFGQRLSSGQLIELSRDIRSELKVLGDDDPVTLTITRTLAQCFDRLRDLVLKSPEDRFSSWLDEPATDAIHAVDEALVALTARLKQIADRSEGLLQCSRRAASFLDQFALLTESIDDSQADGDHVHWLEKGDGRFVIHLSPLAIGEKMNQVVEASGAAWVFTSATLTVNRSFEHFQSELGVTPDSVAMFDSPFNYADSVRAWVPRAIPAPGGDGHTAALVECVRPFIETNPGRTFFLFTSHRALRAGHELLKDSGHPLLVQGHGSRARLLDAFRERPRSILLATQSFWEGVDVSGADLRLLIIDKLPFPSPADPVFNAESVAIEKAGGNSFAALALPRTALSLKQGFGRLIRGENDRGVFILGDPRLHYQGYSRYFRDNLPPVSWYDDQQAPLDWLATL